jgi:hypothetical protein
VTLTFAPKAAFAPTSPAIGIFWRILLKNSASEILWKYCFVQRIARDQLFQVQLSD